MDFGRSILVVDDEDNVRKSLYRALLSDEYEVFEAGGVTEAQDIMMNRPIDLIISDFRMPGKDGLELIEWVKNEQPEVVRIMLSAYADRDIILDSVNRGEVFRFLTKPWDDRQLQSAVSEGLARKHVGLDHTTIRNRLKNSTAQTVLALAEAIELKDPYTKGHCARVRDFSLMIGRRIGLNREMMSHLTYAGILHDCGKIGIKEDILLARGPLDPDQRKIIERHSVLGAELAGKVDHLKTAGLFIRQHHERWDGKGYPDGLAGESIHLCARIISIADAYDAMTSDRPYRKGMPLKTVERILVENKGSQFDPGLVDVFLDVLENGR